MVDILRLQVSVKDDDGDDSRATAPDGQAVGSKLSDANPYAVYRQSFFAPHTRSQIL